MRNLMILVKMQLKERLNFKRTGINGVKFVDILLAIIGPILKFAAVTVLCGALFLVSNVLGLFSLTNTVPSSVVSVVFSFMLLMSVISCVVGLTKSMYYAKDNAVLLTLPANPMQVYLSKLIIFTIFELKRNLSFIVPFFIAYYFTHNYPIGAYPWLLLCIFFVSLFTVSIGALLSIPSMLVANFFRQHRWLQISALALSVGAIIAAVFFGISLIPADINLVETWGTTFWEIQDFLKAYTTNFSWLYDITLMMLGETKYLITTFPIGMTALRFAILVGVTAALFALGVLIVKPLFYSMASKPFEYRKRKVEAKPNKARSRRISSILTEWLIAFKSTDRTFANFGILVSVPMMIFLLNKIFHAMVTKELGDHMIVAFNILIVLLVVLNSNSAISSIFSREGRSSYLIKTQPCDYPLLIVSKLLPNATFVLLSLAATFVILIFTLPISIGESVMLSLSLAFIYLAHLFFSAELDLMNPQIELYATVGSSESNPNETKSTVVAFLAAFAVAGLFFLLLLEPGGQNQYLKLLLVSAAVCAYTVWMFFTKLRLYYKEK